MSETLNLLTCDKHGKFYQLGRDEEGRLTKRCPVCDFNKRENCPKTNVGKVFGGGTDFTLQGSMLDPNYCIVGADGECQRHKAL